MPRLVVRVGYSGGMTMASPMEAMCFGALRVRLLADSNDEGTKLQKNALGGDLTALLEMICDEYGASPEQREYLKKVASIRNKLLHLELSRATGRIRPLADQLHEGGVWMADLGDASVEQVSKTSTEKGRIFGWMLESAGSGAFDEVARASDRACEIICSLRDERIEEKLKALRLKADP